VTSPTVPTLTASPLRRIGLVVGFALMAFALTAVVGGIWTALLALNLATTPIIPWSVAVMALVLWFVWAYLGGAGWPRRTAAARQRYRRARPVPRADFVWAVIAGLLAIVALGGVWIVLFQIANVPERALPDYSRYPLVTVALALVMASLVNAVVEEAAFRGYVQGVLERIAGGVAAILLTTLIMSPEHALTQGFVWPTLVFYALVDIMLGVTAYLTQSILPGIVIHAVGLLIFFTLVWPGDVVRQLSGSGTADGWFGIHVAQTAVFGLLSILAFLYLARRRRQAVKRQEP
jgi:membrane protease YdiL (CAAX protease family)